VNDTGQMAEHEMLVSISDLIFCRHRFIILGVIILAKPCPEKNWYRD
jgi:hypothetical protein